MFCALRTNMFSTHCTKMLCAHRTNVFSAHLAKQFCAHRTNIFCTQIVVCTPYRTYNSIKLRRISTSESISFFYKTLPFLHQTNPQDLHQQHITNTLSSTNHFYSLSHPFHCYFRCARSKSIAGIVPTYFFFLHLFQHPLPNYILLPNNV